MTLKEQIEKDYIEAFKLKEELKTLVLRMLKSSIKNKEIATGNELNDAAISEVIAKEIKQRKDSALQFANGGRPELEEKENKEIEILTKYLPKQMSESEIAKIIDEAISQSQAAGPKDMGKVMSLIMPKLKGKADGSLISKIVKEKLSK